jgi:hypothetical protein
VRKQTKPTFSSAAFFSAAAFASASALAAAASSLLEAFFSGAAFFSVAAFALAKINCYKSIDSMRCVNSGMPFVKCNYYLPSAAAAFSASRLAAAMVQLEESLQLVVCTINFRNQILTTTLTFCGGLLLGLGS